MSGNVCLSRKVQPMLFCLTPREGREGDKAKCKAVAGGCCLHYIIFPFPLGIFLWGWCKQQVSGCERGQAPDCGFLPPSWALSLARHQPAKSWLPVFLGLPPAHRLPGAGVTRGTRTWTGRGQLRDKHVRCSHEPVFQPRSSLGCSTELRLARKCIILHNSQQASTGSRWGAAPTAGQSASQGSALAQGDHALYEVLDSTEKWIRAKRLPLFLTWGVECSWVLSFDSESNPWQDRRFNYKAVRVFQSYKAI